MDVFGLANLVILRIINRIVNIYQQNVPTKSVINIYKRYKGAKFFCPVDRKPVNSKHIVSVPFIDRLILSSKVKCTFSCCDWVGELGNLKDHQPRCEYLPTKCPNKQCLKLIQRKKMDEHLKICKYSLVPCKYQTYGCKTKIMRWKLLKHEKVHNKIDQLEGSRRSLRESYSRLESNTLKHQTELDEVILHNHLLQGNIKYLKSTHQTELKQQQQIFEDTEKKYDRECKKTYRLSQENEKQGLYYFMLLNEKEEKYKKLLKENVPIKSTTVTDDEVNERFSCKTFFFLFIFILMIVSLLPYQKT